MEQSKDDSSDLCKKIALYFYNLKNKSKDYEPINVPINEPINISINEPINVPINEPINISINDYVPINNIITEIATSAQIFINEHKNLKIKMCTNKPCLRKICNFAHTLSDMKLLPHIALFNKYALELSINNENIILIFNWVNNIFINTFNIYSSLILCTLPKNYKQLLIIINNILYKYENKNLLLLEIYNTIKKENYSPSNSDISFDQFKFILMFINLFGQKHFDCLNKKCTFASNCNHNCKNFGPILHLCFNCINNKQLKCNSQNDSLCIHFTFPIFENVKKYQKRKSGMSSEYNIKFSPNTKHKIPITQNEIDMYLLEECNKYNYIKKIVCKTLSTNILINDLSYIGYKYIYYRRNNIDKNSMNIIEWLKNQLSLSQLKIIKIEENIKKTQLLLENAEIENNMKNILKIQNKLYTLKNNMLVFSINQMKNIKCDLNILKFLINNSNSSYIIARSICRCVSNDLQDFFPIEVVELFRKEEKYKNSMIPFREILKELLKLKVLKFYTPIQSILDQEFPYITSDLFDETIIEIQNKISIRRNELKLITYKEFLKLFDKFNISNMPLFNNQSNMKEFKIEDIKDFLYKGALLHYFPKPFIKENYHKNFINVNISFNDILTYFINYKNEHNFGFITIFKKVNTLSSEIIRWNKIEYKENNNNIIKEKIENIEINDNLIIKTNKQKKLDKKLRAEELMLNINKSNNIKIIIDPLELELDEIYTNIIKLNKIKELSDINLNIGNTKITIKNILYFKIQFISKYFDIIRNIYNKIIISEEKINDDFYDDNWITKENDSDNFSETCNESINDNSNEENKNIIEELDKPKQMTFIERKKLVLENRKKLASVQNISKINKNPNQELEQNAYNELLKKYDSSSITKQMISQEVKKLINERRIKSINKRKELLNKGRLEFEKNKNTYKNFGPKDAYTIEAHLLK